MILLITAKKITGLQYHRQVIPFKTLGIQYEIRESEEGLTDDYLKKFSCISFLREIDGDVQRYKSLGLKIHFDIDDYWKLPRTHSMYFLYKSMNYSQKVINSIKSADFVTTTTNYLADKIKEYNKNVYVLPNAINPLEEQWSSQPVEISHNRLRFGYVAGSHHQADVEMIHPEIVKMYRDASIADKWQVLIGGFNFNANPDGSVSFNPYYKYLEQLFTCVFYKDKSPVSMLRKSYAELLDRKKLAEFRDMDDPYMRLNAGDTFSYGKIYDSIDVSLVPLIDNNFNRSKSQLKLIEAGFKKKAVLVSPVIPYTLDFTKDNVMPTANNEWHRNMKYLINNPNKVEDLREKLHEYIIARYHIDVVNIERKQIFEQWLK